MPKLLGQAFSRKKKMPLPVRLRIADPEYNLQKVIKGTPLKVPLGPCLTVRIGRVGMPADDLVANAAAVIAHTVAHLRQQDNPVQSITLKTTDSPALPIWRRPRPTGAYPDLKKFHSDASSAASDTGVSRASDTAGTSDSELVSDAGETLSTRDTISEVDTGGESLGELETFSELDSEAGDADEAPGAATELPLISGMKGKKRRH